MRWTVRLSGADFKWDQSPAWWTATFIGSNDRIPKCIPEFGPSATLVSLIGGMSFLKLMVARDWDSVVLFDRNINEITKLIMTIEYIKQTPYPKFAGFEGIQRVIESRPNEFYAPQELARRADILFGPANLPPGNLMRDCRVIIPVTAWPEYNWHPTQQEYERIVSQIRRINRTITLNLPEIEVNGTAVMNLSNSHISDRDVLYKVKALRVFTIRMNAISNLLNPTNSSE